MGDSGPPPQKMAIFCPKMALKCHFWAENSGFWGRVVSLTPPHPISPVIDSEKHMFQGEEPKNWLIQGRPPKKWPFFAQKWLKNANFWPKTVFFGLGWSV